MDLDTILGIVLILVGALVLLGEFSVGFLLPVLGIVLIVLAVLMFLDVLAGSTLMAIVSLVVGLLLYLDVLGVPGEIVQIINLIAGIVLIILGIAQVT